MEPSKPFVIPELTIVKPLKSESRDGFVTGIHGDDLGDTVLTCSKQDTCRNHPHRCWECRAGADILEYYPLYKHRFKDMNYIDFLSEVEVLAVSNGLRFVMERAPLGCGFLLYFQHDGHSAISEMVSWLYDKQDFEPVYHKLDKIATEFSRQHEYLQFKQATNSDIYDDYDCTTSGLIEEY